MAAFRLERVLRLRGQLCRLRRLEMQAIEDEQDRLDSERTAVEVERATVLEEIARRGAAGGIDVTTFQMVRAYEDVLGERARAFAARMTDARVRLVAKRDQLALERREERKLESLAEQHRAAAETAAALAAERLLDELVLARHAREAEGDGRGS